MPAPTARWTRIPIYLGKISFGLYVFHLAVQDTVLVLFPVKQQSWQLVRVLADLLMTMLLATLSYEWLEKPFLRLKTRFARVQSRPA